jgi:hypothetical protein
LEAPRDRGGAIDDPPKEAGSARLSLVLAAAMFVLVVDTSLMNVSIATVVRDLDTTVSAVRARSRWRRWSLPRSS